MVGCNGLNFLVIRRSCAYGSIKEPGSKSGGNWYLTWNFGLGASSVVVVELLLLQRTQHATVFALADADAAATTAVRRVVLGIILLTGICRRQAYGSVL
jgi:hypothetical protein